jgi:hypothetical protein
MWLLRKIMNPVTGNEIVDAVRDNENRERHRQNNAGQFFPARRVAESLAAPSSCRRRGARF